MNRFRDRGMPPLTHRAVAGRGAEAVRPPQSDFRDRRWKFEAGVPERGRKDGPREKLQLGWIRSIPARRS